MSKYEVSTISTHSSTVLHQHSRFTIYSTYNKQVDPLYYPNILDRFNTVSGLQYMYLKYTIHKWSFENDQTIYSKITNISIAHIGT